MIVGYDVTQGVPGARSSAMDGWGSTSIGTITEDRWVALRALRGRDIAGSSTGDETPVQRVWWFSAGGGMMRCNTLPNDDFSGFWIPYTALRVYRPEEIELPDTGSVAN